MRIIAPIRSLFFLLVLIAMSAAAFAQFSVSVNFAPPELPVYEQPLCPGDGYLWTPGYWAYGDNDYYWVPGTWVMAPEPGLLWTPAYWSWVGNGYVFNEGYWGPQVGFYGGVSYGFGYYGNGYEGGRWQGGQFYYNRSVNNVNETNVRNVYNARVTDVTVNRVSYNGGRGGINARPSSNDQAAAKEKHIAPVAVQTQHAQAALTKPELRASVNHGKPAVAATPKPGAFDDRAAVPAKQAGAPYNPPAKSATVPPVKTSDTHETKTPARAEQPAPNSRPESGRPQVAQPSNRPEPSRNEQVQRQQVPPAVALSQQQHNAPSPAEAKPATKEPQHQAQKPEENKQKEEQPKREER
jgi:hypothetical protein